MKTAWLKSILSVPGVNPATLSDVGGRVEGRVEGEVIGARSTRQHVVAGTAVDMVGGFPADEMVLIAAAAEDRARVVPPAPLGRCRRPGVRCRRWSSGIDDFCRGWDYLQR